MFAVERHGSQKRGGSDLPYVHHCFDVARRVAKHGFRDENVLVAAILHDTVEDTDARIEEISERFGFDVAKIVGDLTLPPEARNDHHKKHEFQLQKMLEMGVPGRAIKIADKTSNVFDLLEHPPPWSQRAIRGYSTGAREVVLSIADASTDPISRIGVHYGIRSLIDEFLGTYEQVRARYGWDGV